MCLSLYKTWVRKKQNHQLSLRPKLGRGPLGGCSLSVNVCLSKRQVGVERVSFLGQPLESTCSCPVLFKGCFSRVILKASAAVKQVLSNSCLGSGTSWAQRAEDVGRFDGEGKLRAGGLGAGRTLSALWSLGLDWAELHIALALDESSVQRGAFLGP